MAARPIYILWWVITAALTGISPPQSTLAARVFDVCSTGVTVDGDRGLDCSSLGVESWDDLNGSVCDGLQDVLDIVNGSEQWSEPQPADCVEIFLVAGHYEISAASVLSGVSVILRGEYNGMETFTSTTLPQYCIDTPNNNNGNNNNNNNNGNDNNNNQPPAPSSRQAPMTPTEEVDLSLCDKVPYEEEFVVHVAFSINVTRTVDRDGNTQPFYAWYFVGSAQVEMTGIDFSGSPGILGFEDIDFVSLENCSFSNFYLGAVDIFNSPTVYVTNNVFAYNGPADILKSQSFRGHSSALSIAFNDDTPSSVRPLATISNCVFYNNTVITGILPFTSLENLLFPGSGGALVLLINSVNPTSITVQDCLVERNYATIFGAGVYVVLNGFSNHSIQVFRTQFRRNLTPGSAGGLQIGVRNSGLAEAPNRLEVYDSEFSGNEAAFGGGVYFVPIGVAYSRREVGNFAKFQDCSFSDNFASEVGSAIAVSSPQFYVAQADIRPLEICNCSFSRNSAKIGGVVGVAYVPLAFYGSNTFDSNRGTAFTVIGTRVDVHGEMTFSNNNDPGFGTGAVYVSSLGQIRLYSGANVSFIGNVGGPGAALVIETIKVPDVFSRLLHNPLCTLLLEKPTESPANWHRHNVSFKFEGNRAMVGSAVFLDTVNLCSWTNLTKPFFDRQQVFRWPFIEYGENTNDGHQPDQHNPKWFVQTKPIALDITNTSVSAYPGEDFDLGIESLDELGRPVATALLFGSVSKEVRFLPAALTYERLNEAITTSFQQLGGGPVISGDTVLTQSITSEVVVEDTFTLGREKCPPGNKLKPDSSTLYYTCDCNVENEDIIDCERRTLILKDHLWGSIDREGSGDRLVTHPCPGGYCRCTLREKSGKEECPFIMDVRRINDQCDCDRKGLLCGECRDGMGVSALLNRCVECNLGYGFLIMGLIIADVLVVLGFLAVMVPFPPWLYPCVFHLQMLPYLTEHFPVTFEKARPYLYYVSSAIGLYFPYDFCLGEAMDPRASYAFRYIPFLVALLVCPGVLLIRRYKFVPVPWHGLWWLVLLLYTPVVHTSMSLLNCPMITDEDGDTVPRWYINGELECFSDPGHAILGLFAIAVLAFCILLIGAVVLFSQDIESGPRWPHHLVKPLTNDFVLTWWGGVELARRMLLLLFIVAFPDDNYPAIFVLAIVMSWYGLVQPYKRLSANVLEIALSSTVLLMLYARNTEQIYDDLQVLPDQSLLNDDGDGKPDCVGMEDIDGMTPMAILLAVLYYLPLLVTVAVVVIWIGFLARSRISRRLSRRASRKSVGGSLRIPQRPQTSTIVDMNDLSPPPTTPPGINGNQPQARAVRRPTTSIVQFKDLEDVPQNPCELDDQEPGKESTDGSRQQSHQLVAKVLNSPSNGRDKHEPSLPHMQSDPELKVTFI